MLDTKLNRTEGQIEEHPHFECPQFPSQPFLLEDLSLSQQLIFFAPSSQQLIFFVVPSFLQECSFVPLPQA